MTPQDSDAQDALVAGDAAVALLYPTVASGPEPYARALPAIEDAASGATVGGKPVELTGTVLLEEDTGGDRGVLAEV
ncbi:MAG: hypothetical protein ACRDXB_17650, partial [Actinomycetes bacterium]